MSSSQNGSSTTSLPTTESYCDDKTKSKNRYSKRNSALNVDLIIDTNLANMNEEEEEEYTPTPRAARRQLSTNTRRRSTLLYLEKYGLDQPNWHENNNSNYDEQNDDNDMDATDDNMNTMDRQEQPVKNNIARNSVVMTTTTKGEDEEQKRLTHIYGPNTQEIITVELQPTAVKNIKNHYSHKRPTQFIKPEKTIVATGKTLGKLNDEFYNVHMLMEEYTDKLYMEGYLYKRVDINSDGTLSKKKNWTLWYVELCGAVLTLWDASNKSSTVYPQYINITDSIVNNEQHLTSEARTNIFSLNSAGANRYLFQTNHTDEFNRWILALRLSSFECARIHEIYTRAFLTSRPNIQKFAVPNTQKNFLFEGFVQVRFSGQTTSWKKVWAVVSNHKVEKKLLFNKKYIPTRGQIMFYESKKAKHPFMTMENVIQAYTMYPESPKMIDVATIFKVEGSLHKISKHHQHPQLISSSCCTLFMTSSIQELVQWLMAVYDAFQLYGRPQKLLDDPTNPKALNFADGMGLFLDTGEIEQAIDMNQQVTSMTDLATSKQEFTRMLTYKLDHGSVIPQAPSPTVQSPTSLPSPTPRSTSPPSPSSPLSPSSPTSLSNSNRTSFITQSRPASVKTIFAQQLSTKGPTQLRTVTYASDDEDDNNEYEEDEEDVHSSEEDDDKISFQFPTKPIKPLLDVTVEKGNINTSKSSSEVSDESSPATTPDTTMMEPLPTSHQPQQRPSYFLNSHHRLSQQQYLHLHQYASSEKQEVEDKQQKDGDDDNIPIALAVDDFITQNSLLDRHHRQSMTTKKKMVENKAKAARQPYLSMDEDQERQSSNPLGLVDLIPERDLQTDKRHSRLLSNNSGSRRSVMTMSGPNSMVTMEEPSLKRMSMLDYQQMMMQHQYNMYSAPPPTVMMTAPPSHPMGPRPYAYPMMMSPIPTSTLSSPVMSPPMTPPMLHTQPQQQLYSPHQRTMSSPTPPTPTSLSNRLSQLNEHQQLPLQQPLFHNSTSSLHSSNSNNSSLHSGSLRQKKHRNRHSYIQQQQTNNHDIANSFHSLPRRSMYH